MKEARESLKNGPAEESMAYRSTPDRLPSRASDVARERVRPDPLIDGAPVIRAWDAGSGDHGRAARDAEEGHTLMRDTAQHTGDPHLDSYVDKYRKWLRDGMIRNSSKVIPVRASLEAVQWILPAEQTLTYLRKAGRIALADCACRVHYGRCDRPTRVCLLFDDAAERAVGMDGARRVSAEEAERTIQVADEAGLVHMALYASQDRPFAVCNCCSCCCHDLQLLLRHGRADLTVRSDYVAETDAEECVQCGRCVERCTFGARTIERGRLAYDPAACYGCGLCVSACPANATSMTLRSDAHAGHERGRLS
jgi:ferredoxin